MLPLQLKDYFYPHVSVTADNKCNPQDPEVKQHSVMKVMPEVEKGNEYYQVSLGIDVNNGESGCCPYTVQLLVIGVFEVDEAWEDIDKLLLVDGASMLYSAAREYLITITARGPWPPLALPTYSFLAKYRTEKENEDAEVVATEGEE